MQKITKKLISLDLKDKKILAELFRDGKAHISTIAKNTKISKDVVNYRISKLIETGVMTNVSTIIDIRKLGWTSSLVFFKLMNLNKNTIDNFIRDLQDSKFVVEILELAGGWDFAVRFYHKDSPHLSKILSELESKFVNFIDKYSIFFISSNIPLPYNALFERYSFEPMESKHTSYKPDSFDLRILSAISSDGRKSLARLQNELKENRMTIYNRINKMISAGVIHSFRPNLFTEKLGFHWYEINLKLGDRSDAKVKSVVDKLKKLLQVHFVMTGFGFADIVFYVQVKHVQELQSILYTLRETFSNDIKSIESASTIKDHKWDFFPEGLLDEL
jgi:Lrp/AsnC family transcriptional regulator, leucine-responsive regulatory protein